MTGDGTKPRSPVIGHRSVLPRRAGNGKKRCDASAASSGSRGWAATTACAAVRQALAGVPGLRVEEVRLGLAVVSYDPGLVAEDRIRAAVAAAGYEVAR